MAPPFKNGGNLRLRRFYISNQQRMITNLINTKLRGEDIATPEYNQKGEDRNLEESLQCPRTSMVLLAYYSFYINN